MRKKALTIILPLCAAMAMTACGGNADTTEVEETTVIEESMEADAQAEAEAPTMDEEAEVVEAEVTVDEEPEDVEEGYNPATQYEGKFYMVSQDVLDNDKSEEYGIYSESCFDLDQYLDENGSLPMIYDQDDPILTTYSGRWAYPEVTQCDIFNNMLLKTKVDMYERFDFSDKLGNDTTLTIDSGPSHYDIMKGHSDTPYELYDTKPVPMFTADTVDGTTDVLKRTMWIDFGGTMYYHNEYIFKIGNFSITVKCQETEDGEDLIEMTEEEIQEIIDNIRLTNGLER